ncbi:MAG: hypothetical protein IPP28_00215 [Xanthomonadales bacterium]|nr:hypothetical protein [Xanthomonadales bacterium]
MGRDDIGQRERVTQAEIEALRADRMNGLRGIADHGDTAINHTLGELQLQRP